MKNENGVSIASPLTELDADYSRIDVEREEKTQSHDVRRLKF
jgi:hypothetical protein